MTTGEPLLCDTMVVAVTGSPAALQMPRTILMMRQVLAREVRVMMSRSAQRFLRPYSMRLFSGSWVHTETHSLAGGVVVPHVDLTSDADLMLVMPATANAIAKAAHGLCDDLISTAMVACPAPVVLVPTMNGSMWRSVVVQRNVNLAREVGYHIIEPGLGVQLADMNEAAGAMPAVEQLVGDLATILASQRPGTEIRR
jgi:phosphopantothenoylcysteine synthetase/decarboxylase